MIMIMWWAITILLWFTDQEVGENNLFYEKISPHQTPFFVMILDETGICKIEVNSDITTIKCQQWIDKDISLTGIDY